MYCSTASEDFFYIKMLVGVERNRLCILFDVAQIFPISPRFLPSFPRGGAWSQAISAKTRRRKLAFSRTKRFCKVYFKVCTRPKHTCTLGGHMANVV